MLLGRFGRMGIRGRCFALLSFAFAVIFAFSAFSGNARALADDGEPEVLRSRAFRLKHLSNSEAKARLEALRIGARIDLLPHNSLIVTASEANDLVKASSLLNLTDAAEAYTIDVIADWPGTRVLPSSEQIAGRGGFGDVGTLMAPPPAGAAGVIVDVHNGQVIAAAPAMAFESVKSAFAAAISPPAALKKSVPAAEAAPDAPPAKAATPDQVRTGPPLAPQTTRTAAVKEGASLEDELLRTLTEAENAAAVERTPPTVVQNKAGLFGGWGPAVASAQTIPSSIAAPRSAPLAAEMDVESVLEEAEPNAVETEAAGEEAVEETDEGDAASNAEAENDGMTEAAEEDAESVADEELAGEKDVENVEVGEEESAEEAGLEDSAEGEAAENAGGAKDAEGDAALMQLVKMLQESAAAEEAAAKDQAAGDTAAATGPDAAAENETSAANAETATEDTTPTETMAPPSVVRPPLPTPKGPLGSRTPPQVTGASAKIETKGQVDAGLDTALPNGDEAVQTVIVLPEKVRILDLIELVGKQLGINYMYDPKDVTGEVMLKIHDGKIKVKDMYALLESVLKFRNLAMTRRGAGNLVTIMPVGEATAYDPVLRRDSSEIQPGDVIVTTIHQLKHIDTATAQQMLTQMKLGITFNAIAETQTLIITDYAYRMGRIEEILKLVDVRGKMRKFHSRKLKYLTPSDMAAKVLAIAQQMGTISITVSQQVTTVATPTPATPGRAAPTVRPTVQPVRSAPTAQMGGDEGVYLDTDDRTNRVLMVGLEEDITTVDMIIDSLDVEKYGLKTVKEYPMQYVEAGDVLETLYELGTINNQPTARTSMLPSRSGTIARPTTRTPTPSARTPVTTPTGTYTPGATQDGEPQISVRLSTNSLLVNATAEQHNEIAMIIRFVDVEQQEIRTVQEYEIQYVDIQEVVDTLSELGIIEAKGTSGQQSARRAGTPTPPSRIPTVPGAAPGAAGTEGPSLTTFEASTGAEITSQQPQIAVLESTNSLLVYATPKQHETISLVVTHVDRELTSTSTPYVVYALENQDPEELAATLNEIIQATVATPKSPDSKVQTSPTGATAGVGIPPKREKNEIQIVPDPKSYSLIVYADKKNQQWVSELIKELDQYRPQVHLDVTLVEITKDDQFNFDLEVITRLPDFAAGGKMVSSAITALVEPFPDGQVFEGGSAGGAGKAFFSDDHVQALLSLVDSKNYGRILARPSLLVKDNQPGEIKAEKTIYVGLSKTTTVPSTSENYVPITDVAFEPYTSGVTLSITPHIASDKVLQLEITLDRTDFVDGTGETTVGGDKFAKPLDTVSSNLGTWAVLPDGATIILGGIESISQSKNTDKIPILGDIPIIGGLFRGVANTDRQSRLYVFVKATILKPGEELSGQSDIEKLSLRKRQAFERDEAQFQNLEGVIPGQKTEPLDPERILEDDEYITRLKAKREEEEAVTVEIKLDAEQAYPGVPLQSSPPGLVDDAY